MKVQLLKLDDIVVDIALDVRGKVAKKVVEHYMEIFDELPPVDVFNGRLLADGFHRVAAAKKLGREKVNARIHPGDRNAAMVFAATANAVHGLPLNQKQRRAAIERLLDSTDWSQREVARKMGVSDDNVSSIVAARAVAFRIRNTNDLPPSHLVEVGRAPEEQQQALADRAAEDKWSRDETRAAANILLADDVSDEQKHAILDGAIPPFDARPDDGDPKVFRETLARMHKEHAEQMKSDPEKLLYSALEALGQLANVDYLKAFNEMPPDTARNVASEVERYITVLQAISSRAPGNRKLEVVA